LNAQFEWDASAFTTGLYFVSVFDEAGVVISRMKLAKN